MKKNIMIMFICFVSTLYANSYLFSQIRFIPNTKIKYSIKNELYIKKNIKFGKYKKINKEKLKKIIIGAWNTLPYEVIIFNEMGLFIVHDLQSNARILYQGKWEINDNMIFFKLDNSNEWQKGQIKEIIYKQSTSYYKHSFTIIFEKDLFFGGGLSINFN